MDGLPSHLRRNSLDYYYLSVWPGLRDLEGFSADRLPPRPEETSHLYVHLPFCSGLCDFCSYFVAVSRGADAERRIARYTELLLAEVDLHLEQTALRLKTIYLGGGTPSLLPPAVLAGFLDGLRSRGALGERMLGTIEAHPEVFEDRPRAEELLDVLSEFGIGRVSIGLQTIDDGLLRDTNRRHAHAFLPDAIELLRDRGFVVNLDLMYGLPGGSMEGWLESLRAALEQEPDSLSTYFTFIDYGTALWREVQEGTVSPAPHAEAQLQHIAAQVLLEDEGFLELPNDFWAKPAADGPFRQSALPSSANSIGLGAGAYGYFPGIQYFNEFNLSSYAAALGKGSLPVWRAALLDREESLRRDVMFSFKNDPELRLSLFAERYGVDLLAEFGAEFELLETLGLIEAGPEAVVLTAKGRLVVEEIAALFSRPVEREASRPRPGAEEFLVRKHHYAATYEPEGVAVADP